VRHEGVPLVITGESEVEITLQDGRRIAEPTEADIVKSFAGLSDAGDFIILNDEHLGEVRAAGPQGGTFLVQCDLPKDGRVFCGERGEVGLAEAIGIFQDFLRGRTEWSGQFGSVHVRPSQVARIIFILAGVAGTAYFAARLLRRG
jgi:hypothetical protein